MRSSSRPTDDIVRLERARPLLGTVVALRAEGPRACVERGIARAFAAMTLVQQAMSFHDPQSMLSRLNRHACDEAQTVDAQTWRVLRAALALARASAGRFDPTVGGPLVGWGHLPAPAQAKVDPAADWRDVVLGRGRRVRFRRPLWLDLGGIAKGYAVDRAVAALRAAGAHAGVVNAGGDLRAFGDTREVVRVREPSDPTLARPLLQLREGAVATSAGYFSTLAGRSALVDTRAGRSLGHGVSVTVCAPRALWADALTKVVLADADAAIPLLHRLHAQAVVLAADGAMRRLAA